MWTFIVSKMASSLRGTSSRSDAKDHRWTFCPISTDNRRWSGIMGVSHWWWYRQPDTENCVQNCISCFRISDASKTARVTFSVPSVRTDSYIRDILNLFFSSLLSFHSWDLHSLWTTPWKTHIVQILDGFCVCFQPASVHLIICYWRFCRLSLVFVSLS